MNLTSPIKKNNFDLQVSSYKAFYQNHLFFLFFFVFVLPSYVNNQQPVPKFNSSVWPGPTEKNSFPILLYINKPVGQSWISES